MISSGGGGNIHQFPNPNRPPPPEPFEPFFASQMEGRTIRPREWIVDGVLMRKTVLLLAGAPKIGKSLLLQQILTAIALGEPWLGKQTLMARCFGLFTEDPQDEIERREAAILELYDRSPADLELDLSWEAREDKDAIMVEFEKFTDKLKPTPLWYQVTNFCRETGIQVVGIDTAATTFGGNENFRNQVTAYMRAWVKFAVAIDGAVIINVHPSKSNANGYSGTTGWLASARFGLSLGRPPEYDPDTGEPRAIRVLRGLGSNYSAGVTAERLRFERGVLVPDDPPPERRRKPLTTVERVELEFRLLEGLRRVRENGGAVPADEMAASSLPNRARRSADANLRGIALNDMYLAQQALIDSGRVMRVEAARKCMLRPADGTPYPAEKPWISV